MKVAFRNASGRGKSSRAGQGRVEPSKAIITGVSTLRQDKANTLEGIVGCISNSALIYLKITFSILAHIYYIIKTMGFIMTFLTRRVCIPIIHPLLLFPFLFYFHVPRPPQSFNSTFHRKENMQHFSFLVWVTLLCKLSSTLTHFPANGII